MVRWPRQRPSNHEEPGSRKRDVSCPSALRPSRLASLAPQDEGPSLKSEKVGTSSGGDHIFSSPIAEASFARAANCPSRLRIFGRMSSIDCATP